MSELKITTHHSIFTKEMEKFMLTYKDKDIEISLKDFNKIINKHGHADVQLYTGENFNEACKKNEVTYAEVFNQCDGGWLRRDAHYFSFNGNVGYYSVVSIDEDELQELIDTEDGIRNELIKLFEKEDKTMEQTVEVVKSRDGQHSLVAYTHKSGRVEFVVCSFFSLERPIGSQWDWGHYFWDINDALEYMLEKEYITPTDIMSINYKEGK